LDLTLIELHHALVLMHGCLLVAVVAPGWLSAGQLLIADQVDARVLQRGLVRISNLRPGQCRLIRPVVDFHQQIALVNGVAFTVTDVH